MSRLDCMAKSDGVHTTFQLSRTGRQRSKENVTCKPALTPNTNIFAVVDLYPLLNGNVLIFPCITFPDKNERRQ